MLGALGVDVKMTDDAQGVAAGVTAGVEADGVEADGVVDPGVD
jgi:hypothetical protein